MIYVYKNWVLYSFFDNNLIHFVQYTSVTGFINA